MDPPPLLLTLVVVCFGYFFAAIVDSQQDVSINHPQPPRPPHPPAAANSVPRRPPTRDGEATSAPRPRHQSPTPQFSPPPPHGRHHPPPPRLSSNGDQLRKSSPRAHKEEKINTGKKIGLMFLGTVVLLQVCVGAFLVIRRRQMFKLEHET